MAGMKRSEHPYRNCSVKYVAELFEDIPKAKGKLVHTGNGGYPKYGLKFGCRVYFDPNSGNVDDSIVGVYNCQVWSDAQGANNGREALREYSVVQEKDTTLDAVINAILYNEYVARTLYYKL